jgi:RalA-binding protein 1
MSASPEDAPSDSDDFFVTDDSGTENTENDVVVVDSSPSVSPDSQVPLERQTTVTSEASPATTAEPSRASQLAATRGLSVALSERGNRHSRIVGLPVSPRLAEPIGPSASSSSQPQ